MKDADWDAMSRRERDARIAEQRFGWTNTYVRWTGLAMGVRPGDSTYRDVPNFTTDMNAALRVWEGYAIEVAPLMDGRWRARFGTDETYADSAPEVICKAILRILEPAEVHM